MAFKVSGLKEDKELGVMLDFTHEELKEPDDETVEVPAEWLEQVYMARERLSNQAVNMAKTEAFQKDISTEDYVNELKNEMEAQRDEDYLKERERLKDIIDKGLYPEQEEKTREPQENKEFKGPTTISYEFSEPPLNRGKTFLEIPVYRCEGSALVKVEVVVDRYGSVISANVLSVKAESGSECFHDAAFTAALHSQFRSDMTAPEKHRAIITYTFISQ